MAGVALTRSARYHARRRARLVRRLGSLCRSCGAGPGATLQVAHLNGDGGLHRASRGSAGEITRLLSLADEELHREAALMCAPCHRDYDLANGHYEWSLAPA